jgi:C-terminal processing protease CtpA/Prc
LKLTPELVRAPPLEREMKKYRDENFEFTVRDITFFDKVQEEWDQDQSGVLVAEVVPGGWAALARLAVGDLIQTVDSEAIRNVGEMETALKRLADRKPDLVVYRVLRGIHTLYLEMQPVWE